MNVLIERDLPLIGHCLSNKLNENFRTNQMSDSLNKQTGLMNPNRLNDTVSVHEKIENKPNLPAKDIYSSYIFSTSNRSLSKYGERLLMEVISVAQEYTIDSALGIHKLNFGEKYKEKFALIDIPVKNLLNSDDTTNYTKAKEAAVELMKIYHTVEAPVLDEYGNHKTYKDGSPQYQFASFHLLDKVTVNQKPGIVSVKLGEETWSQILDMGKGYTRYNLLTAKSLNDVVAIRLFQILSNSSEPLQFSIERIKGILGLKDKYVNNPTGFVRRVILPAEDEIREKCPFEVVHELVYEQKAGKGRPSVVGLIFKKIMKQSIIKEPTIVLEPGILTILVKTFGFDDRGLRSNLKLFQSIKEAGHDIEAFLLKIEDKAKQAKSPQAYVIKSLQNLLSGMKPPVRKIVPAQKSSPDYPESTSSYNKSIKQKSSSAQKSNRLSIQEVNAFSASDIEEI